MAAYASPPLRHAAVTAAAASSSSPTSLAQAPHRLSLGNNAASNSGGSITNSTGGNNNSNPSLPFPHPSHSLPTHTTHLASSSSSALVTSAALTLSHPHSSLSSPVSHVSYTAFALLTAEMANTLARSTTRADRKRRRLERRIQSQVWGTAGAPVAATTGKSSEEGDQDAQRHGRHEQQQRRAHDEEELRKSLEAVGEQAGAAFAERLSRDRLPFQTTLDVLKFLCKEVWISVWEKQVDNLRTNHRGVYVLQDNNFKPLLRVSASNPIETVRAAKLQLAYPTGLLRGVLSRLGVPAHVVAEPQLSSSATLPLPVGGGGGLGGDRSSLSGGGGGGSNAPQAPTASATTGAAQQPLGFVGAVTFHIRTGAAAAAAAASSAVPPAAQPPTASGLG